MKTPDPIPTTARAQADAFLDVLHGDASDWPDDAAIKLHWLTPKGSRGRSQAGVPLRARTHYLEAAAKRAKAPLYTQLAPASDAVLTAHKDTEVTKAAAVGVRAMIADVDVQGGVHADPESLPTRDEAQAQIAALADTAMAPTAVVDTGGGYLIAWSLDRILDPANNPDDGHLLNRMQAWMVANLPGADGAMTADWARRPRLPGSVNGKDPSKRPEIAHLVDDNIATKPVELVYLDSDRVLDTDVLADTLPYVEARQGSGVGHGCGQQDRADQRICTALPVTRLMASKVPPPAGGWSEGEATARDVSWAHPESSHDRAGVVYTDVEEDVEVEKLTIVSDTLRSKTRLPGGHSLCTWLMLRDVVFQGDRQLAGRLVDAYDGDPAGLIEQLVEYGTAPGVTDLAGVAEQMPVPSLAEDIERYKAAKGQISQVVHDLHGNLCVVLGNGEAVLAEWHEDKREDGTVLSRRTHPIYPVVPWRPAKRVLLGPDGQPRGDAAYEVEVVGPAGRSWTARQVLAAKDATSWKPVLDATDAHAPEPDGFNRAKINTSLRLTGADDRTTTYEYLRCGWWEIDGRWTFVAGAGSVTADGIVQDIPVSQWNPDDEDAQPLIDGVARLGWDTIPDGDRLREVAGTVADSMRLAPRRPDAVATLWGAVWSAPLRLDTRAGVFVLGRSDAGKSKLASWIHTSFGKQIPAGTDGWGVTRFGRSTTPAGIIRDLPAAGDICFSADNFKLDQSRADQRARDVLSVLADYAYGVSGGSMATAKIDPARTTSIMTGEVKSGGLSLQNRIIVVPVAKGDIDLYGPTNYYDVYRDTRGKPGHAAELYAAYLSWLAARRDRNGAKAEEDHWQDRHSHWYGTLQKAGIEGRPAETAATLYVGAEAFYGFAESAGIAGQLPDRQVMYDALETIARSNADVAQGMGGGEQFAAKLTNSLETYKAHYEDASGTEYPTLPDGLVKKMVAEAYNALSEEDQAKVKQAAVVKDAEAQASKAVLRSAGWRDTEFGVQPSTQSVPVGRLAHTRGHGWEVCLTKGGVEAILTKMTSYGSPRDEQEQLLGQIEQWIIEAHERPGRGSYKQYRYGGHVSRGYAVPAKMVGVDPDEIIREAVSSAFKRALKVKPKGNSEGNGTPPETDPLSTEPSTNGQPPFDDTDDSNGTETPAVPPSDVEVSV